MDRFALVVCAALVGSLQVVDAQSRGQSRRPAAAAAGDARNALPVRRVVLYKNGVGYFEHLGTVRGTGSVSIDFNSAQLDDALKSLTALDLGDGRITGISYNSELPTQQRLAALRLPIGAQTTLPELLGALRGARLEVRSGERIITGRLLGVERRTVGRDASQTWRDYLSLVSDGGDIRTVELTPSVAIRLAERESADQVGAYLGVVAATRAADSRRMTIATTGTGQRDLLVSYVSEVPIWKTSYRIVLAPDGEAPLVQGWAIVDNTTAEDWTNVDLSLVAGAPQSFIQQISQPRYVRRPIVQPPQGVLLTPQTHDPTLSTAPADEASRVGSPSSGSGTASGIGSGSGAGTGSGVYRPGNSVAGGVVGGVAGGIAAGAPPPPPAAQAAPVRVQDAPAPIAARELTDLFEYRLTNPISIPRNQSALVPILNAHASIERVSLWNGRTGAQPLRALWLTNTTGLTLDGGSFTVLDEGAFAGEGLIEPLKPEEKRLLSYAVDLGVQIESRQGDERQVITRLTALNGIVIDHREERTRRVYTIRNNDTTARTVLIEHPTRPGWRIVNSVKPAETSATAYRFAVSVPAKQTTTFAVEEGKPLENQYDVWSMTDDQVNVLIRETGDNPTVRQALQPIVAMKATIAELEARLTGSQTEAAQIAADEERTRENLRALKQTSGDARLLTRYIGQLTEAEDRLDALRKEQASVQIDLQRDHAELAKRIQQLALSIEVK